MRKPLRFWGLFLAIVVTGSMATWAGLTILNTGLLGRPSGAATASDRPGIPKVDPARTDNPVLMDEIVTVPAPAEIRSSRAEPADWAKAPELQTAVDAAFRDFAGIWSVAVTDFTSGSRWSFAGDQRYHPASTIKLPVTLYAITERKAGRLSWDDVIQYTEGDFESPGGGAFETAPFGEYYPVENLVNRALIYSNNVAVNMLGRHLEWQNIREWSRTIGGELYRNEDASPSTTVLHELAWWRYLYQFSLDDPKTAALVLEPLSKVAYDGRIAAGLPQGVRYVHKFGSNEGQEHDGGIVWTDRPYALVIMTHGATVDEADTYLPLVTAAIHKVMSH